MSDESQPTALNAIEAALKGLAPSARLDRDQLMYCAGQASQRPRLRLWTGLAAAAVLISLLNTALLYRTREPQVVHIPAPAHEAPAPALDSTPARVPMRAAPDSYAALRRQVLEEGADSLPPPPASPPVEPLSIDKLLGL